MALANFTQDSLTQLKALLGSYGNEVLSTLARQTTPYIESRWYEVTEKVEIVGFEGTFEYKAKEIYTNGDEITNGLVFDSEKYNDNTYKPDEPTYLYNLQVNTDKFVGDIEIGKAYQVEVYRTGVYGEEPVYYIIPKGGGGGGVYRLLVLNDFTLALDGSNATSVSLVDDKNVVEEALVTVRQNKYTSANFYEGEILYAIDYSDGGYLLDPFLAGIGGTSA